MEVFVQMRCCRSPDRPRSPAQHRTSLTPATTLRNLTVLWQTPARCTRMLRVTPCTHVTIQRNHPRTAVYLTRMTTTNRATLPRLTAQSVFFAPIHFNLSKIEIKFIHTAN